MLTPKSRLRDALSANQKAVAVTVYAGDVQDVAGELDPKHPGAKKLLELTADAERPGVQVRCPVDTLRDVLDAADKAAK